jgi:branched-chain amino acid transport system substrate-binding protein
MKRKTRVLSLILTLGIGLVSFLGCDRKEPEKQALKVGSILGLTGDNAAYGVKMQRGLQVALDQINAATAPDQKKIELVVENSQWEPKLGISAYRKMYDLQGIRHFTAICGSKIALAICGVSKSDDIVIVDAISGAPKLTTDGGPKYFRVYASDAMAGAKNVEWATEEGCKTFAIAYVEDEWGVSYKDAIVGALQKRGLSALTIPIGVEAKELRAEAKKITDYRPDALFAVVYANLAVPLVQQVKASGFAGKIYGGDNLSSTDFAVAGAEVIEGVRLSLPAEANSPKYQDFVKAYRVKFNEDPDAFALKSFDAFNLLVFAVRNTDGSPSAVVRFLREMPPYEGASGPLSFDEHGDLKIQQYNRRVYRQGKLEPFGR